jgi:hypothetical protein
MMSIEVNGAENAGASVNSDAGGDSLSGMEDMLKNLTNADGEMVVDINDAIKMTNADGSINNEAFNLDIMEDAFMSDMSNAVSVKKDLV